MKQVLGFGFRFSESVSAFIVFIDVLFTFCWPP